jgi:hypothetical protein
VVKIGTVLLFRAMRGRRNLALAEIDVESEDVGAHWWNLVWHGTLSFVGGLIGHVLTDVVVGLFDTAELAVI